MEKWATWRGFVLGMHGARTGKMGSREKGGLVWGALEDGILDVEKGHYVGQCLSVGKWDIYHYSVEEIPCVSVAESWVSCPKLRHFKRLRAAKGGCFVVQRVRNYNRRKWYVGTSVSCQTNAFQEKMYTHLYMFMFLMYCDLHA